MSLKWVFIALALLYLISPVDLFPDYIPIFGRLDDALIIVAILLNYYFGFNLLKWLVNRKGRTARTDYRNQENKEQGQTDNADSSGRYLDPYEVLGIQAGASAEEIRRAYREISQKYHPDKVSHLGREFQELAAKKFVQIQEAYETLRRRERD